jgi:hypothetical protein
MTNTGSEQESVGGPGLIGFPRFGADGLTRCHGPGSEGSPMFTDPSAALALIGAADGIRPFPSMPTTAMGQHIWERKRGQQLSAPTQSDGAMARTGRSGKAKPPRRYRQIRGYRLPSALVQSANCSIQGSQRMRCSAGSCLRSAVQGWNPKASNPRKGKALKSPPIGGFSEFSRRAEKSTWNRRVPAIRCPVGQPD